VHTSLKKEKKIIKNTWKIETKLLHPWIYWHRTEECKQIEMN